MLPPNRMKRETQDDEEDDELEKYGIAIVILTEFETLNTSQWRQHTYEMERLIRVT